MTKSVLSLPLSADTVRENLDLLADLEQHAVVYQVKGEKVLRVSDGFDSQLERDYADELSARGVKWHLHGLKFSLGMGVWYTPDFDFVDADGVTVIVELKGHKQQKNARDSRTRWKVAAAYYPQFRWQWVERKAGRWITETLVTSGGRRD